MSKQDATPSWSGYIFQGEVALCKALEKMTDPQWSEEGELTLEHEEDFALRLGDNVERFQVKAYTTHHYSKYRKAWRDMMERFPDNPEANFLLLQKGGVKYESFAGVPHEHLLESNVVCGVYTLESINQLIQRALIDIPNRQTDDFVLILNYCCKKINDYVKKRHLTGMNNIIPLSEIIQWIKETPEALTEEICWHQIEKIFFESLEGDLNALPEGDEKDKFEKDLIEIGKLTDQELHDMIKHYLNFQNDIHPPLTNSLSGYFEKTAVSEITGFVLRRKNISPLYKRLQYQVHSADSKEVYQLTTFLHRFRPDDNVSEKNLQSYCQKIIDKGMHQDVDYFITSSVNISKEEMKPRVREIFDIPEVSNGILDVRKDFGFLDIDKFIDL